MKLDEFREFMKTITTELGFNSDNTTNEEPLWARIYPKSRTDYFQPYYRIEGNHLGVSIEFGSTSGLNDTFVSLKSIGEFNDPADAIEAIQKHQLTIPTAA